MKLSLVRRGGGGGNVILIFVFVSHYLIYFHCQKNEITFPLVESVLPMMITGK